MCVCMWLPRLFIYFHFRLELVREPFLLILIEIKWRKIFRWIVCLYAFAFLSIMFFFSLALLAAASQQHWKMLIYDKISLLKRKRVDRMMQPPANKHIFELNWYFCDASVPIRCGCWCVRKRVNIFNILFRRHLRFIIIFSAQYLMNSTKSSIHLDRVVCFFFFYHLQQKYIEAKWTIQKKKIVIKLLKCIPSDESKRKAKHHVNRLNFSFINLLMFFECFRSVDSVPSWSSISRLRPSQTPFGVLQFIRWHFVSFGIVLYLVCFFFHTIRTDARNAMCDSLFSH